jgi:hypothetical protein
LIFILPVEFLLLTFIGFGINGALFGATNGTGAAGTGCCALAGAGAAAA